MLSFVTIAIWLTMLHVKDVLTFQNKYTAWNDETQQSVVHSRVGNDIESISEGSGVLPGK